MNALFITELDVKFESRHDFENALCIMYDNDIVASEYDVTVTSNQVISFDDTLQFTSFVTLCREAGLTFVADTI
jgi:hypothetical protein